MKICLEKLKKGTNLAQQTVDKTDNKNNKKIIIIMATTIVLILILTTIRVPIIITIIIIVLAIKCSNNYCKQGLLRTCKK